MRLPQRPRPSSRKEPSPVVPASAAVAVGVDLVVPPDTAPERVTHRIAYTLEEDSQSVAMIDVPEIDGPEVAIDRQPAVEIKPPFQGDGWLATTACCTPNVHRDLRIAADGRRIATAETFAVDWALVENDRLHDGDGSRTSSSIPSEPTCSRSPMEPSSRSKTASRSKTRTRRWSRSRCQTLAAIR